MASPDLVPVKTALVCVYDTTGIKELGTFLRASGVHIISAGNTAGLLRELGCKVESITDYTGSSEILDGRVQSLHVKVHCGLLTSRRSETLKQEMQNHGFDPIDLAVVNLHPFHKPSAADENDAACIDSIDIAGCAMVRASAKNNAAAAICTNSKHYSLLMQQMTATDGCTTAVFRRDLAAAAYTMTAAYDVAVGEWMAIGAPATKPPRPIGARAPKAPEESPPKKLPTPPKKSQPLHLLPQGSARVISAPVPVPPRSPKKTPAQPNESPPQKKRRVIGLSA